MQADACNSVFYEEKEMKILSFGEILWDIFPDEKKIGGAPFNFAAHAAKLGAESYFVSAVGSDENGTEALKKAKALGIRTDYIYVSRKYPTGVCSVTLSDGKPTYALAENVAYDHIPDICPSGSFDAIYMGTLAMRSPESRRTFEKLLKYTERKEVFFDVNFRGNYYTRELVNRLLRETTVLKISDEEVSFFGKKDMPHILLELANSYPKLKYICVTLGKEGAIVFDCKNRAVYCSDKPKSKPVSTVGAGDSFSACFLVDLLCGRKISDCLDRAVTLSDYVVTQLGAVPDYDPERLF